MVLAYKFFGKYILCLIVVNNILITIKVQVVGVTCASCPFPCMNDLKFPVVVLDECSQMTEPASLLPIAR